MRQEGDDEDGEQGQPELRLIAGGRDEARCVACGARTGLHARWWYDGENALVPYCPACARTEFGDA